MFELFGVAGASPGFQWHTRVLIERVAGAAWLQTLRCLLFRQVRAAMAPAKKKQRTEKAVTPAEAVPTAAAVVPVNKDYVVELQSALNVIQTAWPGIESMDPLPEMGAGGQEGLHGFLAPFNASVYDTRYAEGADMAYTCGVNFFWQNPVMSPMPWVPLYKERVMDMVKDLTPGLLKHTLVFTASFDKGKDLPKGGCVRLSPDEVVHGVVFKVAERIAAGASAAERKQWLRTLLSVPCVFKRLGGSEDAQYAEANSLRQDIMGTSRSVTHTARQLIYNVHGFKVKQERGGKTFGAKEIAKFWAEHVRLSTGQEYMKKFGTIDTCLTIYSRLFSIPECENMVRESEVLYGPDGPWNSIWTLQEFVQRCGTKAKMIWCMASIQDWLKQGKIEVRDVGTSSMRPGPKSLTDVALTTFNMKAFLLGPWLDGKHVMPTIKDTARSIFSSHAEYRAQYNPFAGTPDTTFMFAWPKAGAMIFSFIEMALFQSTGSEDALMRQAALNLHNLGLVVNIGARRLHVPCAFHCLVLVPSDGPLVVYAGACPGGLGASPQQLAARPCGAASPWRR